MPDLREARVAIVGLGLMGGSLGLALKARGACREVVGIARRQANLDEALAMGAIDWGTLDLAAGVRQAEMVVLAPPVRTVLRQLPAVAAWVPRDACILDMGSTKSEICRAMADLPNGVQPVGGHPMCGKEQAGIAVADAGLYDGKTFVLSPLARTSDDALRLATSLAQSVGSRVLYLEPAQHDRLVAAISHLPYLLACALVAMAERVGEEDAQVWQVAASGFRDTTRLAASDVTMLLDILMTNQEAVLAMVEKFQHELETLARVLRQGDEERLRARLETLRRRRSSLWK